MIREFHYFQNQLSRGSLDSSQSSVFFKQELAAFIQYSSSERTNTVYIVKKTLASTWLKVLHTDYRVPKPIVAIRWQRVAVFKSWLTMTLKSLDVLTTGSSLLFTLYVPVSCGQLCIILHLEAVKWQIFDHSAIFPRSF